MSRTPTRAAVLTAAAALTALVAGPSYAATGDLDATFSGDGLQSLTGGANRAQASALQSDGKVVVAGTGTLADGSVAQSGVWVTRYDAAGAPDAAFGTRTFDVTPGVDTVRGVTVDASGRVLVAGYSTATRTGDSTDVFVARLTAAGALDTTFSGDGIAIVDRTNHDMAGGIAVDGTRILVGASADDAGNWANKWTVLALTATGAPDTGFSGDGVAEIATTAVGNWYDGLRDLAVGADHKITVGGTSAGGRFATARFTGTGAVDASYDGDGAATVLVGLDSAGSRLVLQKDGKPVLVGRALGQTTGTDLAAVRWTTAGKLDTTFAGDGSATLDVSGANANDEAWDVALAKDEKLVLVGNVTVAAGLDLAAVRLNWNGTPDTSWSGDGRTSLSTSASGNEYAEAVVVDGSDRITAAGSNVAGWQAVRWTGGATVGLSVSSASVVEPDTGTANATFTVTLSAPSSTPVTVKYATAAGTATAGGDYTTKTGTVTLAPGQISATFVVPVVGDTVREADETFTVTLTKPTNAGLVRAVGTGTVRNDD